jgi:hypothetical protein
MTEEIPKQPSSVAAAALVAWMKDKEITVDSLRRVLGVAGSTVYSWRNGNPPSRKKAIMLAKLSDGAVPADCWD